MDKKKKEKEKVKEKKDNKLIECEKERDEYLELSRRLKADFINFKRNTEEQLKTIREVANKNLVVDILPVLDSLQLALRHTPENLKDDNWVKGMLGIKGQLEGVLKSVGVEEINALKEKFDPELHEAIDQEES